nr:alpha/beta hydrolase [uncultured Noviherbaspirillum sp.]
METCDTDYIDQGTGTPVLFIHGSLADCRSWEHQQKVVGQSFRFIALNLRYHGTKVWPDEGTAYSIIDHVRQVIMFIRALNLGKVHLIGHSYGAEVAMYVALQAQDLLSSVVLHEPPGDFLVTGPDAPAILEERAKLFAPAKAAANTGRLDESARLLITAVMNHGPDIWDKASESSRAIVLDNARTLPLLFSALPPTPLTCDQLNQIKVPVLVINGEKTMPYFERVGQRLTECIEESMRTIIPHTTHASQDQDVDTYNKVLLSFLKG